jgi:tetratricopeptide (TPR) repeat protein
MPLHIQAAAARMGGDPIAARRLYEESIELNKRLDDPFVAGELYNLGFLELSEGNLDRAGELSDDALREGKACEVDYLPRYILLGRGALAIEQGDAERGVRVLAAGQAAFEQIGEVLDPDDQAEVDRALEKARAALGAADFARAEAEGGRLSVEEALL